LKKIEEKRLKFILFEEEEEEEENSTFLYQEFKFGIKSRLT
jgi:hypothetical protein